MSIIYDWLFNSFDSIYDVMFAFYLLLSIAGGVWFFWVETRLAPQDDFLQDPTQGGTR